MINNTIIKKMLSLVMLVIFTFSITPKKYLHDLVADHTDFYGYASHNENTVNKPGLDCEKDDLVVSVPFIESSVYLSASDVNIINAPYSLVYNLKPAKYSAAKDGRGPPAMIA